MNRRRLVVLTLLAALPALPAPAQPAPAQPGPAAWPHCTEARDGQQIGANGSLCECRHETGGTLLRRPAGWRWSCDILRSDESQPNLLNTTPTLPPGFAYAPQIQQPQRAPTVVNPGWGR